MAFATIAGLTSHAKGSRLLVDAVRLLTGSVPAGSFRLIALGPIDGHLELSVGDDGAGFDVADARKRAARGSSQGLLGMQERVELAGGDLHLDSAPGRGTTVEARLPLAGGSSR